MAILRCPSCGQEDGDWAVEAQAQDDREVRDGELRCGRCGKARIVDSGIVDMLENPPEFVTREAAGLGRFAELMANDGWDRDRILELPYLDMGYWYAQAVGMEQVLEGPETAPYLKRGARILDVGSNTCWASAIFAQRGLDVVALDISTFELQGLKTADWWMQAKDIHFERVLGVMFDLPFATASLDLVFCSEVLHHNHRANLHATFREFHRVLKPGGKVIVINEPLRALCSPKIDPGRDVAEYEGHEHAYMRTSYLRAARRGGFALELLAPRTVGLFAGGIWSIKPETPARLAFRMAAAQVVRRSRWLRRAFLAWRSWVLGDVSLYMVATKHA